MYTLKKNALKKEEWDRLIKALDQANLQQTWAYGETLEKVGWITERYTIYHNKTLIALFNVFKRKYWYSTLIKIQRGPLFLSQDLLEHHLNPVLILIRKKWVFWKLQFLRIEFELPYRSDYDKLVHTLGFRRTGNIIWESTQIDLTLNETTLLENLDGKWRNALIKSIKNQLVIVRTKKIADFEWLIEQYETLKKKKRFIGASQPFIYALYKEMIKSDDMHILLANTTGKIIAGIIVVTHGKNCSYLLGWNSDLGRKLNAHHFLLWHAIKDAKAREEHFFDLGGVLTTKHKSISNFKLGLNGKKYTLLGEFY